jgi:small conductance mechanosensitive channel
MARFSRKQRDADRERMFETRSHAWAAVGLEVEVNQKALRRARWRLVVLIPLLVAAFVGESLAREHVSELWRKLVPVTVTVKVDGKVHTKVESLAQHHHWIDAHDQTIITVIAVVAVLALGWLISREVAHLTPVLFRRMDPAMAGTVAFLIRLVAILLTVFGGLAAAGASLQTLALGGAFTAVIFGLAAQQTLGNLFAGIVLITARPFRVGERVRLQAGAVGGTIEGIVSSLGLLYTTFARGQDRIKVPNNVVLSAVVVPLREPEAINVRVHLSTGVSLAQAQEILAANVSTPTSRQPSLLLEEVDGESVIVRVQATPEHHADGAKLADEIIAALTEVTGQHPVRVED